MDGDNTTTARTGSSTYPWFSFDLGGSFRVTRLQVELETKVREDFTITEKAPTADPGRGQRGARAAAGQPAANEPRGEGRQQARQEPPRPRRARRQQRPLWKQTVT